MSGTGTHDSFDEERIDLDSNDDQIPETCEPSNKKQKIYQPRSVVWPEFKKFVDKDGVKRAKCKHCDKVYKSESKTQDNEWNLRKKVLNFCPQENLRGLDIGKAFEKCLIEWGVDNVFTISVDNASANDVAIDFLKRVFQNSNKCLLNGKWTHIRCVAHILNLVVQDGIKKVENEVNKVRWVVRWIRQSYLRIAKYKSFASVANPGSTKHLIRDVPTRWKSTYHMLNVAQAYENTFARYDLEEYDFKSELENAGFRELSSTDWKKVRDLCHFLKAFFDVTLKVSRTLYVTSNSCMEEIYFIRNVIDQAIVTPNLCEIALAMKTKFDKYFGNIQNMNLLLYYALILDPTKKVEYLNILFENRYGKESAKAKKKVVMDGLQELYNEYVRIHSPSSTTTESSGSSVLGKRKTQEDMSARSHFKNALREKMKSHRVESVDELDKFLGEKAEEESQLFNVLEWWKVNSPRFPILSSMARDLFAIPVSTVASESVFSTSGRVLDPFRSSLSPRIVESLICTQDWLRGTSTSTNKLITEEDWEAIQEIDEDITLEADDTIHEE